MKLLLALMVTIISVDLNDAFLLGGLGGGGGGGGGCGCGCQGGGGGLDFGSILGSFGGGGGGGGGCCCQQQQQQCCAPQQQCGCRRKRMVDNGDFIEVVASTAEDPRCNNEKLRTIILDNITEDSEVSKMVIHDEAENQLKNKYAVICSEGSFSYITYGSDYCLDGKDGVHCYAFKA